MNENKQRIVQDSVRVEYAAKNFVLGSVFIAVTTIFPFVIRTVLIRSWGLEYAGITSLFSSILNAINISELGIGEALTYALYKPMAQKKEKEINALLNVYRRIYNIIGLGILMIGIALMPFLPHLISGSYPSDINIYVIYLMFLLHSVSGYLIFNYCDAVLLTNQASYIKDGWLSLLYLAIYALQVASLLYTDNYYLYMSLLPIGSVLAKIIIYWQKKKRFGNYYPSGKVNKNFWRGFGKRIFGASIRKLRTAFRGSVDSIVISAFLGLAPLAKYNNYILILSVPQMLIEVFRKAILQSLGNSVSIESKASNLAVVKLYSFLTQWLGICFASILGTLFHPFISIWIGETNTYSHNIEVAFSVYFYTLCMTKITDLIRNSTGLWWEGKWIPVLETMVNLGINVLFIQKLGVVGVLYATVISIVFVNIPCETWCVYHYYFHLKPWRVLLQYVINFFECIIIVTVTQKLSLLYEANVLVTIMVRGIISIVVPNILFFILHLKSKEMWEIIGMMKRVVRRFARL